MKVAIQIGKPNSLGPFSDAGQRTIVLDRRFPGCSAQRGSLAPGSTREAAFELRAEYRTDAA